MPDGAVFACIYLTPGHQPMTSLVKDPPDRELFADVQVQSQVAGPSGAPAFKAPVKKRFTLALYFPAVRFAVYASDACLAEIQERERALKVAADDAKEASAKAAADAIGDALPPQVPMRVVRKDPPG
jgi:hypothetical protein